MVLVPTAALHALAGLPSSCDKCGTKHTIRTSCVFLKPTVEVCCDVCEDIIYCHVPRKSSTAFGIQSSLSKSQVAAVYASLTSGGGFASCKRLLESLARLVSAS